MSTPASLIKRGIRAGRIAFVDESQALAYWGLDAHGGTKCGKRVRGADGYASKPFLDEQRIESNGGSKKNVRIQARTREESEVEKDANNNLKNPPRKASVMDCLAEEFDARVFVADRSNRDHKIAKKDESEKERMSPCKKVSRLDPEVSDKAVEP